MFYGSPHIDNDTTGLPFIQVLCILLTNEGHSQSLSSVAAICLMTGVTIVHCKMFRDLKCLLTQGQYGEFSMKSHSLKYE